MTIIIPNHDGEAHDTLRKIFENFLYPRINPALRAMTQAHLEWMCDQKEMFVNTKIETSEAIQLTRITIEISHQAIPSLKAKQ